ncbi:MAG: bifunctional methylenetetrahydrofolate dehydrogenase/methenyltetrahydrofolate cyclohydrolase FolD [Candidatus Eisenbacteria bacterium]
MMAEKLDGKALAKSIRMRLAERIDAEGIRPGLLLIRVGEDPASVVYVGGKEKASKQVGIESWVEVMPDSTEESALLARIAEANADPAVHGILVQLPVPKQIDPDRIAEAIAPEKDVDGLHPLNQGFLTLGAPRLVSCTPLGVLALLSRHEIPLSGRRVVVLGRSQIVGRPLSVLLGLKAPWADATVTVCHSRSKEWEAFTREADVVIAAMGRPEAVRGEHIRPGSAVVDVGVHRIPREGGKDALVGDVHAESVEPVAGFLSPVPGGVGPLTIALLLTNTVYSALAASGRTAGVGPVEFALEMAGVSSR